MSMMGTAIGVFLYIMLSLVFIVSLTSICYQLSPYSRLRANASLPEWERKTLYTLAGYPPISLLLLIILAFAVPHWAVGNLPGLRVLLWFCAGHVFITVAGIVSARYLRKRNTRNSVYYFTDIAAGCIYACAFIGLHFYLG